MYTGIYMHVQTCAHISPTEPVASIPASGRALVGCEVVSAASGKERALAWIAYPGAENVWCMDHRGAG